MDYEILKRKNDKKVECFYFSMKRSNNLICPIYYYNKYYSLITFEKKGTLFRQFRYGKFVKQVLGKNTIGSIPSLIAKYLYLPNPKSYTIHSLRRTASTWLAESGISLELLKKFGGWKSNSVVSGYVDTTDSMKRKIGNLIAGNDEKPQKIQKVEEKEEFKLEVNEQEDLLENTSATNDLSNICKYIVGKVNGNCSINISINKY